MPEDDRECGSFIVNKTKYYLQQYLDNCDYKITNKQMTDYIDKNLFED